MRVKTYFKICLGVGYRIKSGKLIMILYKQNKNQNKN